MLQMHTIQDLKRKLTVLQQQGIDADAFVQEYLTEKQAQLHTRLLAADSSTEHNNNHHNTPTGGHRSGLLPASPDGLVRLARNKSAQEVRTAGVCCRLALICWSRILMFI